MPVTPVEPDPSLYYSTNLNHRIKDIDGLCDRIAMTLGYPQINVEAHTIQVYDNIAQACELFSKFAGYTEEHLVFHSTLYEKGKGLYMPKLFEHTPSMSEDITDEDTSYDLKPVHTTKIDYINENRTIYSYVVSKEENSPVEFLIQFKSGYYHHATKFLITAIYNDITDEVDASVAEYGTTYTTEDPKAAFTVHTGGDTIEIRANVKETGTVTLSQGDYSPASKQKTLTTYNRGMDNLLNSHRKVIDVFSFEEGTTSGINTLFTIEQTLAQQTYFSYAMGKYGFDLVSWYTLKEWLGVRNKMLSTKYHWQFNEREQRMYMTPDPLGRTRAQFWGAVGAWVEKPIKDIIVEPWVYQYALALTKMTIARIRGKYQGTNLFGGGSPNYSELLSEGTQEKAELENKLYEGTPGFGDAAPPSFFIG